MNRFAILTRLIRFAMLGVLTASGFFLTPGGLSGQTGEQPPASSADLEKRLGLLEERLEQQRQKLHIPGMAIAVVKDGDVILAKGFGLADLANKKEVTPETIFAIGSSTKAFTATMIGILVDEEKMQFDDPVTKFVPEFELQVDTGDEQITVRDLLCHRTGFTRMGVLWGAAKNVTRPEVIGHAANAKPTKEFRKAFQYNNVMYLTAGYSAGQATGSSWEQLIESRLLEPLGMNSSSTSIKTAQQDDRLSLGYRWDEDKQDYVLLPMRNLDLIGPAGSINSNVNDMAQWVKFQLARGEIDGKRLIAKQTLEETWKPQIEMGPGAGSYGLGWMVQDWNKQTVIEHGGNIDGFGAQVALLPDENIGYVLLTNVTATPLQQGSIGIVFDTLIGDLPEPGKELIVDTSGLVGTYEGNFGALQDSKLKVSVQNGKLAVDVPGQQVFELKNPDKEGKWYFELTNAIAVSFDTDESGKALAMFLHQGGLDIECPREGVERPIEVPLEELRPLLGKYRDEKEGVDIELLILNNRLAASVPKMGKVEFFPPDDDGKWAMRAKRDMMQLRFNKDSDGNVETITAFQGGKETELVPLEDEAEESKVALPSPDEVLKKIIAACGIEGGNAATIGHVHMKGIANFVNQGAQGEAELVFTNANAYYTKIELGNLGYIRASTDGDAAWSDSAFAPFEELSGDKLVMTKFRHPLWFAGDWQQHYEDPIVEKADASDGNNAIVLSFAGKEKIPNRKLYVDADTGHIFKEKSAILLPGIGRMPVTVSYSDYRKVGNLTLPFLVSMETTASGEMSIQYESASMLGDQPEYSWASKGDK